MSKKQIKKNLKKLLTIDSIVGIISEAFKRDAPVAQLDRVLVYGTRGYGFDSCLARHFLKDYSIQIGK